MNAPKSLSMKIGSLPFTIACVSAALPLCRVLLFDACYHIPFFLSLAVFVFVLGLKSERERLVLGKQFLLPILLLALLLLIQLMTNRGFAILAGGGYVILCAFICYNLGIIGQTTEDQILRSISLIYKIFMLGLLLELCLIVSGKQPLLTSLLGSAATSGYKNNNPADLMRMLGFATHAGGLNSLLLGSQIAGMLSLFSTIWFLFMARGRDFAKRDRQTVFWLILSFVLLLLTANATILFLSGAACLIYGCFLRRADMIRIFATAILFLAVTVLAIANGHLFSRIFSDDLALNATQLQMFSQYGLDIQLKNISLLDYYLFEFFNPLLHWFSANSADKLLGVGIDFFSKDLHYISGDFGFAADVLLKSGLLWALVFLLTVVRVSWNALRIQRYRNSSPHPWLGLAAANGLITALWLLSSGHYNQAMQNPGAYMLFALHLALAAYCTHRARQKLHAAQLAN